MDLSVHNNGDALARLHAFSAYSYTYYTTNTTNSSHNKNKNKANNNKITTAAASTITTESTKELETFCRDNNLNLAILQRSLDLREQMNKINHNVFIGRHNTNNNHDTNNNTSQYSTSWSQLSPPSIEEEILLRQILLSGFPDCVARRAPYDLIKTGSRRKRLTAYISCDPHITVPIYIHPHSCLYNKDPTANLPEYVLYESLIQNSAGNGFTYMTNVNIIRESWLPVILSSCSLLKWPQPLITPSPYYDIETDCIMCYCIPKYGAHNWDLSIQKRRLIDAYDMTVKDTQPIGFRKHDEVYRWFARLLLEGFILQDTRLKTLFKKINYKDSPCIITQMKSLAKVIKLLEGLIKYNITSKSQLLQVLSANNVFLMEEIQQFLNIDIRQNFRSIWTTLKS